MWPRHISPLYSTSLICVQLGVREDPKLLEGSGGVPKVEWSGWQFDFQP